MAVEIVSTTDSKESVQQAKGMYTPKTEVEKSAPVVEETKGETKQASDASSVTEPDLDETLDADGDETEETPEAGKVKKKGGFQKRIDKLTKGKTLAEQERDYWREQALKGKPQQEEKPVQQTAKVQDTAGKPDPDKFETVGEYYEALAEWKFDQKQNKIEQEKKVAAAKESEEKTRSEFQSKLREFSKTNADIYDLIEETAHFKRNLALEEVLITSENGVELMYDLLKDPDEYKRISELGPLATAREMGKRETRLAKADSDSSEKPQIKTTKAPPPPRPVSKGAVTSTKDPGEMSYREYTAWREKGGGR